MQHEEPAFQNRSSVSGQRLLLSVQYMIQGGLFASANQATLLAVTIVKGTIVLVRLDQKLFAS